jgi:hypothetical protein
VAARAGAGLVGRFLGNAVSEAAAFAAGVAIGPVLGPPVQAIRNEVNAQYPFVPPGAGTLAEGVAQGQVNEKQARAWAAETGIGDDAFSALVAIANVGPGMAEAFNLWRRKQINEAGFRRALKRLGLEQEWIDALWNVREAVLDQADLARAIHRGLIPDPGLLQGSLPSGTGNVPAYPVYPIDALEEAQAAGYDRDHLGVLVGLQGNPMGAHEAAQAQFRGILTDNDYLRAISEGNTRNEWADAIREQSRQIPTARDYLENALRGYSNLGDAIRGASRHGMNAADATLIYQNQGRPMNIHQITQALARGAKFKPEPGELTDPYDASVVEGNIKPAYYELAKALRYTLPSAFVMRQLASSGVWDEAKTAERLKWAGWFPQDADEAAAAWTHPSTSTSVNPRVKRAQDQVYNATHSSYLNNEIERDVAISTLEKIALTPALAGQVVDLWEIENGVLIKPLTAAQIKKAYSANDFTVDEATARLVDQQWSAADAAVYLKS